MGIDERRTKERARRQREILTAAWQVADAVGWAGFSIEKVAACAELGRATVYGYFASLGSLIEAMALEALNQFSEELATARGLEAALDVPVGFAQHSPCAFNLLFSPNDSAVRSLSTPQIVEVQAQARTRLGALARLASNGRCALPTDARDAAAFVEGICLASALVPELRSNTTLRHRWQAFCLHADRRASVP